jgi:glycosyltransferase involved in cell wall biosynthesis
MRKVSEGPARIVYLSPTVPAAQGNGRAMRAGVFLEGLARSHDVTLVVVPSVRLPVHRTDPAGFVGRLASGCLVLDPATPAETAQWPSTLLGTPAGRRRARELYPLPAACPTPSAESLRRLREVTEAASLVHVMRSYLVPWLDHLFDRDRRPLVTLDVDELDSGVQRQLGDQQEAERFERLERHYLPRVDHVYTAADEDADKLRQDYGIKVTTVPNAARPPVETEVAEPRFDLLFVGNLSYAPNIDAVQWFCREVLPRLGAEKVAIVGSDPPAEVRALGQLEGVTVAANVPEIDSWYAASRVAIAPLRVGGGTRIKILEALAHGRPVVATPRGAAGLAVGERNGIVVAGTASEFATACVRLLRDDSAAARIAAAGRARVTMVDQVLDQIDSLTRTEVNTGA